MNETQFSTCCLLSIDYLNKYIFFVFDFLSMGPLLCSEFAVLPLDSQFPSRLACFLPDFHLCSFSFQQQHDQYIGPAYDPSRDLSPNLPSCESSMGDVEPPSISGGSSCSTPSNNNHHQSSCANDICRPSASSFDHVHHVPKLEPPQPPGTPPTPPANAEDASGAICAGCGLRIADRFYLQAVDRRWHAACLQCCQCRNTLDGEITCFSRDGNIYCKKDYYR